MASASGRYSSIRSATSQIPNETDSNIRTLSAIGVDGCIASSRSRIADSKAVNLGGPGYNDHGSDSSGPEAGSVTAITQIEDSGPVLACRNGVARPGPMRLASRQAESMADNRSHRPKGVFGKLFAMFMAGAVKILSARFVKKSRSAAEEITADMIADPRRVLSEEAGRRSAFEARLEARWGRGLDLADLVVHEALESSMWVHGLLGPAAAARQDEKHEALIRLHGKAVLTAREVMVLLRSGYSSGALARWRTLHEVWVVFLVLLDGDEELSRRYRRHDVVESLKGQEEHEETWEALGQEPPDWTDAEREQMRAELAAEFGPAFLRDYGWAAPLFNDTAPKYKQLQERVELDHWRGYYRMASHGTHANPKGISWNIQSLATVEMIWAGPSNAGLLDPAQCTLIALSSITVGLLAYSVGEVSDSEVDIVDKNVALVRQQAILLLMRHAIEALADVDDQQKAEVETMGDLVSRASTLLQEGAPMTAEELSSKLGVDPEALAAALDAAAARGELLQQAHYRIEAGSTASGEQAPGMVAKHLPEQSRHIHPRDANTTG